MEWYWWVVIGVVVVVLAISAVIGYRKAQQKQAEVVRAKQEEAWTTEYLDTTIDPTPTQETDSYKPPPG